MANRVCTSQIRYSGTGRLDITAATGSAVGRYFAPDWSEVKAYLDGPKDAAAKFKYEQAYHAKMLKSYEDNKWVWDEVMAMDLVVLVCFCKALDFCHRKILAKYLVHLGMDDGGEI